LARDARGTRRVVNEIVARSTRRHYRPPVGPDKLALSKRSERKMTAQKQPAKTSNGYTPEQIGKGKRAREAGVSWTKVSGTRARRG